MSCNKCKSKPANNIQNLTQALGGVNEEELTTAYDFLQIASQMTEDKWDFVEKVYQDLYPGAPAVQRNCRTCLERIAKLISHHYRQIKYKK